MKKNLTMLSVVFALLIASCSTYRLPSDIETVTLTDNTQANEAVLIIQDIRWRLWANTARYVVGEIGIIEYTSERVRLIKILETIKNPSEEG